MAINDTYRAYTGNGSQTDYSVSFTYERPDEVVVRWNGVPVPFTFLSPSVVRTTTPAANGVIVTVQRETNIDSAAVVWKNGSGTTGGQLNSMARQLLNAMQEARDTASRGLFRLASGVYDFAFSRGVNVADPVNAQDVVNKRWAETALSSNVSQAIAARTDAQTARTDAQSYRDTASGHATAASGHRVAAEAARDRAETAADTVEASKVAAATSAGQAASNAGLTAQDRNAVAQDRAYVEGAVQATSADRQSVDTTASIVAGYQTQFTDSKEKAKAWADSPVNAQVEPGKYSAKHWANVAQSLAGATAQGIPVTPTGEISSSNVQAALEEIVTDTNTKLDGKSATGHKHVSADITDLATAMSGKANTVHTHAISDVTGLQTALDGKTGLGANTFTGTQTAPRVDITAAAAVLELRSTTAGNAAAIEFTADAGASNYEWRIEARADESIHFLSKDASSRFRFDQSGNVTMGGNMQVGDGLTSSNITLTDTTNGNKKVFNATGTIGFTDSSNGWLFRVPDTGNAWFKGRGNFDDVVYRRDIGVTNAGNDTHTGYHQFKAAGDVQLEARSATGNSARMLFHNNVKHIYAGLLNDHSFRIGYGDYATWHFILDALGDIHTSKHGWFTDKFLHRIRLAGSHEAHALRNGWSEPGAPWILTGLHPVSQDGFNMTSIYGRYRSLQQNCSGAWWNVEFAA